jgi:uncharacterized protein (DUF4415 family)
MTAQKLENINGILDRFLSDKQPDAEDRKTIPAVASTPPKTPKKDSLPSSEMPIQVRRGRPPGKALLPNPPKEKVTLWLNRDLIAQYRDWSWEARRQLSPLIEEAMREYRRKQ